MFAPHQMLSKKDPFLCVIASKRELLESENDRERERDEKKIRSKLPFGTQNQSNCPAVLQTHARGVVFCMRKLKHQTE